MAEPFTLAMVGGVVLTEGIKFLYGQAGELLKRWRARKSTQAPPVEEPLDVQLPEDVFAGSLAPVTIRYDVVDRLADDIRDLRKALSEYAEGLDDVRVDDTSLLETVDALRSVLEAAYGQRLTFAGEVRPESGTTVTGEAFVDEVEGRVAGVRARLIAGADVHGAAHARRVDSGGQLAGVEADVIGSSIPGKGMRGPGRSRPPTSER